MGGMLLFDRNDPNGYPEDGPGWISGGTLAERIRFVQSVVVASGQNGKSDSGNNNVTGAPEPTTLPVNPRHIHDASQSRQANSA